MLTEDVQLPDWIQTAAASKRKEQRGALLCNNKDHLLFYVEIGCLEFSCCHSRMKSLDLPDYIILGVESPDTDLGKAIDVALAAKEILSGLHLPSFVKSDGRSGLHIYVPLDSKGKFETSKAAAEYLCKLIRIKVPNLVALQGSDDHSYGKVALDYFNNEESKSVIAPYSLVTGESPTVATPLLWEEIKEGLQPEDFNY